MSMSLPPILLPSSSKGGVGVTGALKILALPKRGEGGGGRGVGPLPRYFGGFEIVYRGQHKVVVVVVDFYLSDMPEDLHICPQDT